ncbi:hypothetical protein ACIBK1_07000 [Microbispora rosea]
MVHARLRMADGRGGLPPLLCPDLDGVVLRLSEYIGGDIWVRYHRVP